MKAKKSRLIMYFFAKTIVAMAITFYILSAISKDKVSDSLIKAAAKYYDSPLAKVIEEEGDTLFVQCYEIVDDGIAIHTATLGLLEINAITGQTTDLLTEETFNIFEYAKDLNIFNDLYFRKEHDKHVFTFTNRHYRN